MAVSCFIPVLELTFAISLWLEITTSDGVQPRNREDKTEI
jgi:hypothetical protein